MEDNKPHEGNLYDKIFKENAERIFLPLIETTLDLKIVSFHPLKEKMQTTIEREMDFFYQILTKDGRQLILHIEFQTDNDSEMIYRAAEYHGMALRRKKMPIEHVVIYLGVEKPSMLTQLPEEEVYTGFHLVNMQAFEAGQLLKSQLPEVILLAILAHYPAEQTELVLRYIVKQLRTVCMTPSQLSKFLKQLVILARLRNLEELTIKIINDMPITYNIETDYLYKQGIEKGIEKGRVEGYDLAWREANEWKIQAARKMLAEGLTPEKIAGILDLSVDEVNKLLADPHK